jgi:hypothetical protein
MYVIQSCNRLSRKRSFVQFSRRSDKTQRFSCLRIKVAWQGLPAPSRPSAAFCPCRSSGVYTTITSGSDLRQGTGRWRREDRHRTLVEEGDRRDHHRGLKVLAEKLLRWRARLVAEVAKQTVDRAIVQPPLGAEEIRRLSDVEVVDHRRTGRDRPQLVQSTPRRSAGGPRWERPAQYL